MTAKIPLIIDCDPGIDDAAALAVCLFSEQLDVRLITTVAGNVSVDKTYLNARKLCHFWGKETPVSRGAETPLLIPFVPSTVHGVSGLNGWEYPEPPQSQEQPEHAVLSMARVLRESEQKVSILAMGPLTNLALLFRLYPELKAKIACLSIMGGSRSRGNKGIMSEFNIATDPEAAKIVFESGIPFALADLEIGYEAALDPSFCRAMREQNKTGELLYKLFSAYLDGSIQDEVFIFDPTAAAWLLRPDLFESLLCRVDVDCGGASPGQTLVDLQGVSGKEPNCHFLTHIDAEGYKSFLLDALKACP